MARLTLMATLLALLAACVALFLLLRAGDVPVQPAEDPLPADLRDRSEDDALASAPRQGGVYAGVVVDRDGQPIHGARVLLVAYAAGLHEKARAGDREVAVVGSYSVGGEAISDEDGRFRIAADSQSFITRVLAYRSPDYFVEVVEVAGPREDLRLVLQRGGRVVGTVVDDGTGRPVAGAIVDIYMQQKVEQVPDVPEGSSYPVVKRKQHEIAWLATLGRFIPQVLGPRMYGLVDEGTETLRLRSDANGHFEIGPLGSSVQIEFVITHPLYKWMDFDTDEGRRTPKRTVVQPGETIEREFRLRKGEFVSGRVVDDTGQGLPDVFVQVQSISAYYRHWWYKHKYRTARTDAEGRFRVDGLSIGTQQLRLVHPSFGTKYESAEAGTQNLTIVAERLGALRGQVEGIPRGTPGRKLLVVLEADSESPRGAQQKRETTRLDAANQFLLERVAPGSYLAWVKAGSSTSQPVPVRIEPYASTQATFEMGGGGSVVVRVVDGEGVIVDPATARLLTTIEGRPQARGAFVSREGELEIEDVVPGTYRLRVEAPGRVSVTTEPFEVRAGRSTPLPAVTLERWSFLQFGQPLDESGRPAELRAELVIEYRQGEGPFERVYAAARGVPVRPGTVEIRARAGDLGYEGQVEIEEGETRRIDLVLTPR